MNIRLQCAKVKPMLNVVPKTLVVVVLTLAFTAGSCRKDESSTLPIIDTNAGYKLESAFKPASQEVANAYSEVLQSDGLAHVVFEGELYQKLRLLPRPHRRYSAKSPVGAYLASAATLMEQDYPAFLKTWTERDQSRLAKEFSEGTQDQRAKYIETAAQKLKDVRQFSLAGWGTLDDCLILFLDLDGNRLPAVLEKENGVWHRSDALKDDPWLNAMLPKSQVKTTVRKKR